MSALQERLKNYIKGTMHNLQTQHQLVFSSPEQIFAEIVFSVLQVNNQFTGIFDTHHRVNLIAKLLRQKQWRTPKGFYNHWDVGQTFKLKMEKEPQVQHHDKSSERDIHFVNELSVATNHRYFVSNNTPGVKHHVQAKLKPLIAEHRELLSEIASETRYLSDMETRLLKKQDIITHEIVQSTAIKIAGLHEKAHKLHEQIEAYKEAA